MSATLICAALLTNAPVASAGDPGSVDHVEIVVKLVPTAIDQLDEIVDQYNVTTVQPLSALPGTYLLSVDAALEVNTLGEMSDDLRFVFAESNYELDIDNGVNAFPFWAFPFWAFPFWAFETSGGKFVPKFTDQPLVATLDLAVAHEVSTGTGVVVAVIDTGVDPSHPLLKSRLVPGFDVLDNDNDPTDTRTGSDTNDDGRADGAYGHGTSVASLVTLVAPDAKIMPIRALDADGTGDEFDIAEALLYAARHGADVINLSLGTTTRSELLDDAIDTVTARGVVVVAAAGNFGDTRTVHPARHGDTIAVGSINADLKLSRFSNRGKRVDIVMPGENIVSAHPDGRLIRWKGTSAATPLASGFAALAVASSVVPTFDVDQIFEVSTLDLEPLNPAFEDKIGDGVLNGTLLRDFVLDPEPHPAGGDKGGGNRGKGRGRN